MREHRTSIECYIPDRSFEFLNGITQDKLIVLATNFKNNYQKTINQELELIEIKSHFAYHLTRVPFIGFIWMQKVRRAQYQVPQAQSRKNYIMPVRMYLKLCPNDAGDVFSRSMTETDPLFKERQTSTFPGKLMNLYFNIYTLSYYKHMTTIETNPLLKRVWDFRANYNHKLVWRWDYGAFFWAIKPIKGKSIIARI
jgi:hypothetical protein